MFNTIVMIGISLLVLAVAYYFLKDCLKPKQKEPFERPDHPSWYQDLPEDHPDVKAFYQQSKDNANKTKRYTEIGYKKTRMPKEIHNYLVSVSETTDREPESKENIFPRSSSGPPPYIIPIPDSKKVWIQNQIKPILEEWVGFPLQHAATYGPREYRKGSALRMHVDRDTHVISAILHIGRNPDEEVEDWPLQVIGFDNQKKDIFMKPGDLVLYESRSVHHGRETPCTYDYYRNIFVHFYPAEGLETANI